MNCLPLAGCSIVLREGSESESRNTENLIIYSRCKLYLEVEENKER